MISMAVIHTVKRSVRPNQEHKWALTVILVVLAVIVFAVLFQGRSIDFWGIHVGRQVEESTSRTDSSKESKTIEQSTKGDNSPAVGDVTGDVKINIEQKK
jgi:hypothetical protein